jgi:hypothetical protein
MRSKIVISLILAWIMAITGSQAADPPEVTGKFLGNGKSAKLAHGWAGPTEKWQGEESYVLVLSEKPATELKQPDFDAFFGELGGALIVKLTKTGSIFGTEVYHEALEKKPFSSVGTLNLEDYKLEGDVISGRLYTDGPDEFSGETWEVDLTFRASLSK